MKNIIGKTVRESKCLLFRYYASKIRKNDTYYLFVIHLTKTAEVFIVEWLKKFKNVGVISIPYSENVDVKKNVSKLAKVHSPKSTSEIPELIVKICGENKNKKICLIEIGGYSSKIDCQKTPKNIVGSVEDTNQGHWNFKRMEKDLSYPVVSIAQTNLKKIENKFVGFSITYSLEKFLRDYFEKDLLAMKNILIMGYGEIGRGTANRIRSMMSNVIVYDSDPVNTMLARLDGFQITNRESAIGQADIIIGATGQQSIQLSDAEYFKNNLLLVNASSKQVEFPMGEFDKSYLRKKNNFLVSYKNKNIDFHVAYDGFPINFIDDSAFGEIFDIIMSSLLLASEYIFFSKLKPGLFDLEQKIQQDVVRKYFELYQVDNYDRIVCLEKMRESRHNAATTIVLGKNGQNEIKLLLLYHLKLGKWIPIGGHVERFESPESASIRELEEEINICPSYWFDKEFKTWIKYPVIFQECMEAIPSYNEKPAHFHRDFIYVAKIDYVPENKFGGSMKDRIRWWGIDEFLNSDFDNTTKEMVELVKYLKSFEKYL